MTDDDAAHDLSTPDGYLREIERRYRLAVADQDSTSADRLLVLLGKMHKHFDDDEPSDPMAEDLATVVELVKRLVASGKIDPKSLSDGPPAPS